MQYYEEVLNMTTHEDVFELSERYYNLAIAKFNYVCQVVEDVRKLLKQYELNSPEHEDAQKRLVLWDDLKIRLANELRFLNVFVRSGLKDYVDREFNINTVAYYIKYDVANIDELNNIYNIVYNDITHDLFALNGEAQELQKDADEEITDMLQQCIDYFDNVFRPCAEENYKMQKDYLGQPYISDDIHTNFMEATPDDYSKTLLEVEDEDNV
jgi:hypothetical protein